MQMCVQCPRQPDGSVECGYYCLKFMKEVVEGGVKVLQTNAVSKNLTTSMHVSLPIST